MTRPRWFITAILALATIVDSSTTTTTSSQVDQRIRSSDVDQVLELPLFGRPPSPQWSGYLNATAGCDTRINGNNCQLHYWLALEDGYVENTRPKKPLVLWLNGGPGASSIVGFLQELGPLLINATGGLMRNPYGWTNVANVLVLESPVGVGYSYCANQQQGTSSCHNTDRYTATAARAALEDFFLKFDHLFEPSITTDFYIAGESYAGVYIPTLALEILQFNRRQQQQQKQKEEQHKQQQVPRESSNGHGAKAIIPLKGILVGDPCTDNDAQSQARDPLWYTHKNGLVDDTVYETLTQLCNVSVVKAEQEEEMYVLKLLHPETTIDQDLMDTCQLALRKFQLSSSKGTDGKWDHRYIDHYSLYGIVDTRAEEFLEQYMNRLDVRQALHIPDWVGGWKKHAPIPFYYEKEFNACTNPNKMNNAPSMIDIYRQIIPQLDRTWIFNGDSDPCISYEGTRTAVRRIGFPELDGGGYRPWFYHETAASPSFLKEKVSTFGPNLLENDLGVQWGGHVIHYQSNLTFVTVHGSGHMVPMIRPIAALHLFTRFLQPNSIMIAPLLAPNATLETMEPSDFYDFLNQWINEAKNLRDKRDGALVSANYLASYN